MTADQLTKWWALEALADGPVDVFWTLRLRLTFNSGAAFSLGEGVTPFLIAAGVVLFVVLVALTRSVEDRVSGLGVGLLLGGAAGNLSDRLFRGHDGAVIDFVDFQWWPVFNVADAALVIGAFVVVLATRR